jgi:uncharacterized damage-inducible protein DinB
MAMRDALLPEYDHEMGTTRRLLQRTPEAELGWKPHEKSRSLGQLAGHIAHIPEWCHAILEHSSFEGSGVGSDLRAPSPESVAALLTAFDKKVAEARVGLAVAADAELLSPWTFTRGDQEIFTLPRAAALRSFVMNHLIHHRGQFSVYLRLRNVPLPAIYGPTADEA